MARSDALAGKHKWEPDELRLPEKKYNDDRDGIVLLMWMQETTHYSYARCCRCDKVGKRLRL